MTAFPQIEIPDELALEAEAVPGLRERLLCFLRAEISLHKRRQSKRSPEVLEIVKRARERAAEMRGTGVTPEQARADFLQHSVEMMDHLAEKP